MKNFLYILRKLLVITTYHYFLHLLYQENRLFCIKSLDVYIMCQFAELDYLVFETAIRFQNVNQKLITTEFFLIILDRIICTIQEY